jgi:hypothetical protein
MVLTLLKHLWAHLASSSFEVSTLATPDFLQKPKSLLCIKSLWGLIFPETLLLLDHDLPPCQH